MEIRIIEVLLYLKIITFPFMGYIKALQDVVVNE